MNKKSLSFLTAALLILVAGGFGAHVLWRKTHRYDVANTGVYHGSVHASLNNANLGSYSEPYFSLEFEGRKASRWYWRASTNFAYSFLDLTWEHGNEGRGSAKVKLPSFEYRSSNTTGVLTRVILAEWLLGDSSRSASTAALQRISAVFSLLEDAARGSLPPPRHHTYGVEEPFYLNMSHFLLGGGIGGYVYVWIVSWLLLLALFGRKLWKTTGVARETCSAPPAGPHPLPRRGLV